MAKTAEEKSEVSTQVEPTEVAAVSPDFDWQSDSGAGMEGADADSFAIPFLRVIQKTSPQIDEASSAFMPEARFGMFYNTVNGRLYDGKAGITLLPVAYNRRFLRWAPRGADGAPFKGSYMPEEVDKLIASGEVKEVEGRLYVPLPDGSIDEKRCDRIVDTRSHFVIVVEPDGSMTQALFALTSTQIKKSKRLMSMLRSAVIGGRNPPTWMNKIHATTAIESNEQGSWSGVRFEADGYVTDQNMYATGKAFFESINKGEVTADYSKADDGHAEEGGAATGGKF